MGCNPRGDLGTRLPRETFPGGMLGCLRRCWDLAVPLSRSSPLHPERPGCDGPWQDAAPSAGHRRLAGFPVPAEDFRSSVQEESASIRISITLFLVTLCKFFATSWMWGVLASNSSVTAQQFKQAVPLVKKIKGFVISHNKRSLLGRPSENLTSRPALRQLLHFPPILCFSLSPGSLSTETLSPLYPLLPKRVFGWKQPVISYPHIKRQI